ncbi:unnamed protein product, partial [marine sediment metagenome]
MAKGVTVYARAVNTGPSHYGLNHSIGHLMGKSLPPLAKEYRLPW